MKRAQMSLADLLLRFAEGADLDAEPSFEIFGWENRGQHGDGKRNRWFGTGPDAGKRRHQITMPGTNKPEIGEEPIPEGLSPEIQGFLWYGEWHPVESSNVQSARFSWQRSVLTILYNNGATWKYWPVRKWEATNFITDPSKGGWIWSHIRVRGKGNFHFHQRNAVQVA